ncbi:MAG TPA: formimidoylglutamate deiminase [Gemmatimonadota bacterium]|nr:formimidoylglutamate deiminase [Gemmatimonadota bacterium]
MSVVEADLTWTGEGFERGVQVEIGPDGRIGAVGRLGRSADRRLRSRALLPGLISAHSHAFQRGLRGRGERFPEGSGSFWTWRQAMYGLVESLSPERFRAICLKSFLEMRDAGITAVGEFHYLHHARERQDFVFDRLVLEAAAEAGIRIALLSTCYRTGGIGRPLEPAQRRFATPSDPAFWESVDRLVEELDPSLQSVGVAAHSLRAVPLEAIVGLHEETARRGLVFHVHVAERQQEVDACLAEYGRPPLALLCEALPVDARFTAVHASRAEPAELKRLIADGGNLCLCPLTEANLGDGILDLAPVAGAAPADLCLGTDSNARISMVEEMRWLEYGQRLATRSRGVLAERGDAARELLKIATLGGARSLGVDAGAIVSGRRADFAALDLAAPALADLDEESLLAGWIFGGGNSAVAETCVGGRWRSRGAPV